MKRFRFMPKLAAAIVSAAMIFSGAVPAFAEDTSPSTTTGTSTSVTGGTMTFNKYLIIPTKANVPNTTFDFSIASGTAISATSTTQEVKAGTDALNVNITDPSFKMGDATSTSAPADVSMPSGTKIATKTVTVDFSNVTYTSTGIYRYIVKETAENSAFKITEASKALDVYVTRDDNGLLKIQAYVLHSIKDRQVVQKDTADAKESGFVNTYNAHDLAFGKLSNGNQRNLNDEFSFTLTISNALKNNTFAVTTDSTNSKNPTSITTGNDGSQTVIVYLKASQRFVVYGLNDGASYSVKENANDLGYTLTAANFAEGNYDTVTNDNTDNSSTITLTDSTIADSDLTKNAEFTFTNTKSGTVPTGVIFAVAPFAIGAVAIAAFVILKVRKAAKQ